MMPMKLLLNSLSRFVEDIKIETSMKGSYFIFDSVHLMYYKCQNVNFKRDGSFIDYAEWKKIRKKQQ